DELSVDALAGHPLESGAADEVIGLVELDDATQPRLERVGVRVQLVAVEGHARFQPEGVSSAEPDRLEVSSAGLHKRIPYFAGPGSVDEDLETVLARVARPRDQRGDPRNRPLRDRVVAQPV